MNVVKKSFSAAFVVSLLCVGIQSEGFAKECVRSDDTESRTYQPSVTTEGGKVVWLSGITTLSDEAGNDISGKFEAQAHEVFRLMDERMKEVGGTLDDVVKMTVYIKDGRYFNWVPLVRGQYFEPCFPASDLVVVDFPFPGILIEVSAYAVIE